MERENNTTDALHHEAEGDSWSYSILPRFSLPLSSPSLHLPHGGLAGYPTHSRSPAHRLLYGTHFHHHPACPLAPITAPHRPSLHRPSIEPPTLSSPAGAASSKIARSDQHAYESPPTASSGPSVPFTRLPNSHLPARITERAEILHAPPAAPPSGPSRLSALIPPWDVTSGPAVHTQTSWHPLAGFSARAGQPQGSRREGAMRSVMLLTSYVPLE